VTQGDGRTSLSSVAKTSSGCGVYFGLVGTSERLPTWTTRDIWSGTIRESNVWRVDQIFPYRMYIDLNHCDSRI
jgi:hypothetical protein